MVLAPADCPTQLLTQYRRRWGVSRPCSGRERVGPLRKRHQGLWLDPMSLTASRGLSTRASHGKQGELKSTRGRTGVIVLCMSVRR